MTANGRHGLRRFVFCPPVCRPYDSGELFAQQRRGRAKVSDKRMNTGCQ